MSHHHPYLRLRRTISKAFELEALHRVHGFCLDFTYDYKNTFSSTIKSCRGDKFQICDMDFPATLRD